ncbi:MAG TPA: hypothetical protein VN457_07080 [Chlamydiales bacterium]|nr:hypothetical protein [Chlamydiales bacterium]
MVPSDAVVDIASIQSIAHDLAPVDHNVPQNPSNITIKTEEDFRQKAPKVWDAMLQSWVGSWMGAQNRSNQRIKQHLKGL